MTELEYRSLYPDKIRIYDIGIDEFRDATQLDLDLLMVAAQNWGAVRELVEQRHMKYMERVLAVQAAE